LSLYMANQYLRSTPANYRYDSSAGQTPIHQENFCRSADYICVFLNCVGGTTSCICKRPFCSVSHLLFSEIPKNKYSSLSRAHRRDFSPASFCDSTTGRRRFFFCLLFRIFSPDRSSTIVHRNSRNRLIACSLRPDF